MRRSCVHERACAKLAARCGWHYGVRLCAGVVDAVSSRGVFVFLFGFFAWVPPVMCCVDERVRFCAT